jgi:hypothetical protein
MYEVVFTRTAETDLQGTGKPCNRLEEIFLHDLIPTGLPPPFGGHSTTPLVERPDTRFPKVYV